MSAYYTLQPSHRNPIRAVLPWTRDPGLRPLNVLLGRQGLLQQLSASCSGFPRHRGSVWTLRDLLRAGGAVTGTGGVFALVGRVPHKWFVVRTGVGLVQSFARWRDLGGTLRWFRGRLKKLAHCSQISHSSFTKLLSLP